MAKLTDFASDETFAGAFIINLNIHAPLVAVFAQSCMFVPFFPDADPKNEKLLRFASDLLWYSIVNRRHTISIWSVSPILNPDILGKDLCSYPDASPREDG